MARSWGAVLPLGCLSVLPGCPHGRAAPAPPLLPFSRLSVAVRSCGHRFRTLGLVLPHLQDFLLSCPTLPAPRPERWGFQG